jgi:phage-related minor tail protein
MSDLDGFEDGLEGLEGRLGDAAAFDAELARMRDSMLYTGREVGTLSTRFGSGLRRAFDGVAFDGMKLSDALRGVAKSMSDAAYSAAMRPVQNALGGALANGVNALASGILPFADGGAFAQGRVMPFAKGGVVTGPTNFPMRGGLGLMGEAGPEAIMPLTRGADGRLGVQTAGGGRPVQVVMNISSPDAESFRRSRSQIAAEMSKALSRGARNR